MKVLNKENANKFFEMDFRNDSENHDINWYLTRVPDSFYKEVPDDVVNPRNIMDIVSDEISSFSFHSHTMDRGFYCKPSWEWIDPLANYLKGKKVLDVMAGNGLISLCLKHRGIDIDACDIATGKDNNYVTYRSWDFPIISGEKYIEEQAKKAIVYDTILLIWPEYMGDGSDKKICDIFLKTNPDGEIIFIGEDCGGCTGSEAFFEAYELDLFEEIDQHYIPDYGIHDGIYKVRKC